MLVGDAGYWDTGERLPCTKHPNGEHAIHLYSEEVYPLGQSARPSQATLNQNAIFLTLILTLDKQDQQSSRILLISNQLAQHRLDKKIVSSLW